jgi:hypothetical protein
MILRKVSCPCRYSNAGSSSLYPSRYSTCHVDLQIGKNVFHLRASAILNRKICAANGGSSLLWSFGYYPTTQCHNLCHISLHGHHNVDITFGASVLLIFYTSFVLDVKFFQIGLLVYCSADVTILVHKFPFIYLIVCLTEKFSIKFVELAFHILTNKFIPIKIQQNRS